MEGPIASVRVSQDGGLTWQEVPPTVLSPADHANVVAALLKDALSEKGWGDEAIERAFDGAGSPSLCYLLSEQP